MLNLFRSRLRQLLATRSGSSRRRKLVGTRPSEALEERICPSNLNFVGTGVVNFGGGAGNNDLQISVAGDTYTFMDPNETINVIGTNIPGTVAGSGTNTVTFDASTVVTPLTQLVINTNGGTDTVSISGIRPGAEGLEIRDTISADTVTITGDIGTLANPVQTFGVTIAASQLNLGADINTNNLGVAITSPVVLTAASSIDSGTGSIAINDSIDGAFALAAAGGFVTLDGTIGGGTPLTSLTATGETTGVRIQDATVDGAVSLTGNSLILQGDLTGDGSGALSLAQFTNGNDVTLTFLNDITGFSSVNLGDANTDTLQLNNDGDGDVQGTGSFRPGSPIVLTGDTVIVNESIDQQANTLTVNVDTMMVWAGQGSAIGTGNVGIFKTNVGGTLTIQGKMGAGKQQWGANALTVNAVGSTVDFEGEVATNLASFAAIADTLLFGDVPFGAGIGANGDVTLTASNITLGGGVTSSTGSILINGNVTLTTNSSSTGATFRAGAGEDITINGTVTSSNNKRITVGGIGGALQDVAFNGAVSGIGKFETIGNGAATFSVSSVSATSILVRGTSISVGGTLTVVDHLLGLNEGNLHLIGNVTLTANSQLLYSASTLNRAVRVEGTITGGGNDLTIDSGLGTLVMTGAINGVGNMDVTTTGFNYVTAPITVTGSFLWHSNGVAVLVLQDITAGVSPVFTVPPKLLNGATLNP